MELQLERGSGAGSASLRDRKKDTTRRALRAAALRLFNEQGYDKTSVDEIAAAADVSRSTYFRYFGSKEAVLFDEMDENGKRFIEMLAARPAGEDPITAYQESLIDISQGRDQRPARESARMFERVASRDPELQARRLAELERWRDAISLAFAQRADQSEPRPEDDLAAAICITTTQHLARAWRAQDADVPLAEMVRDAFRQLRALLA